MAIDWQDPDYVALTNERMDRLKAIRNDPKLKTNLPALKAFYKDHPVEFISHWGWTFDPRNLEIGKQAVIPFVPFKRQEEFIAWLFERWKARENGLGEKSRDMGVTWLCVGFAVWMWCFYPGAVVGFGSRKEEYVDKIGDPKSIFWKVRFFVEMLPEEFRPAGYRPKVHAPYMRIVSPENGASIVGEAGDNIGRGNRTSIYFLDEAAFVEHAEAVEAALSQTSNCRIDLSTPNGAGNLFYRKRHGGRVRVFIFDWRQDPRKGPEWYAKQKETLDPVIVAQEIDRDYEGSVGDAWFPGQLVTAAMMRGPADVQAMGGLRVGVDVARFGDDKTVVTLRCGRVVVKMEKRGKLDVPSAAAFARESIRPYIKAGMTLEQIAVDTIGVGGGVADILRGEEWFPDVYLGNGKVRKVVVDVNSALRMDDGENYNLRAYMARQVKEWLATGSIPNDPDLKAGMTAIKYGFKGGLLLLESKDDMKGRGMKSPDEYDSLALTFAVPTIIEQAPPRHTPSGPSLPGLGL